jgi:hypothetical protein
MLDALNRTVLIELRDALGLSDSDLYFLLSESEEFLNIAQRKAQVDLAGLSVKVPDRPLVFVKMDSVEYGSSRNGFRRWLTPLVFVAEVGSYVNARVLAVDAKYRVALFVPFGRQSVDIVGFLLSHMNRSSKMTATSGLYTIDVPVAFLIDTIGVPNVEMVLRDKGIKLYRSEVSVQALTWLIQSDVTRQGTGEYGVSTADVFTYKPISSIRVQWKLGWSIFGEDGVVVDEVLPCFLG